MINLVKICSGSATCNLTILKPDETILIEGKDTTNKGTYHSYLLTEGQTSELGEYRVIVSCKDGSENGLATYPYEIWQTENYPVPPNLTDLSQLIDSLPDDVLSDEIKNSLVSKVDNALKSVDKEKDTAAINVLEAVINQIEAQRGNKISEETADMLIAYANSVIVQIEAE